MKKIIIPIVVACSMLISCQKSVPSKSSNTKQYASDSLVYFLSVNDIIGANLTGFPVVNLRTGRGWKAASGTIALTVTSAGDMKSLGIYDLAFQDISGTIYHGIYVTSIELMWPAQSNNIYKLTCKPQDNSSSYTFYALATVTPVNGEFMITIDNGAITDSN